MAAAVPQRVREFNVQAGKAQLTQRFLEQLTSLLAELSPVLKYHVQLPSAAGALRADHALKALQNFWGQRYVLTWGSLDECLEWSPTQLARKKFQLRGWNMESLQAQQANDRELVSFCLMGQEYAHGAWLAQYGRSSKASLFAMAAALAPLGILVEQAAEAQIVLSVEERHWHTVQERWMVRGNGKRFPAGQWIAPTTLPAQERVTVADWSLETNQQAQTAWSALETMQERVAAVLSQVKAFQEAAQSSLDASSPDKLAQMQRFARAFKDAGKAPVFSWMQAVLPAVRTISRRRVTRLLRTQSTFPQLQKSQ